MAHFARHMDLLQGSPIALEDLTWYLDRSLDWPGHFGNVRALGQAIDRAMDQRGFMVILLLQRLLIPAAQELLAPSPVLPGKTMPSMGLALPSALARLTTTTTPPLQGSLSTPSHPSRKVGESLAKHRAATILQCWTRCIWLHCWFNQQLQKKKKHLCLQTLCPGALAYARLVWDCRPPLIPTNTKSSDPKALRHPFRTRGQLLLQRKRVQQRKRPCCCPG